MRANVPPGPSVRRIRRSASNPPAIRLNRPVTSRTTGCPIRGSPRTRSGTSSAPISTDIGSSGTVSGLASSAGGASSGKGARAISMDFAPSSSIWRRPSKRASRFHCRRASRIVSQTPSRSASVISATVALDASRPSTPRIRMIRFGVESSSSRKEMIIELLSGSRSCAETGRQRPRRTMRMRRIKTIAQVRCRARIPGRPDRDQGHAPHRRGAVRAPYCT